jgi:hypothetical protein
MLSGWIPRLTHTDNVGFSRKRTLALAAAITLMCFAGAAAVGALFRAADAEKSVNRTIEIRQQARDLLTIMLNAETGIRGFLLSGDETFLEPYRAAPQQLSDRIERLTALTGGLPNSAARSQGHLRHDRAADGLLPRGSRADRPSEAGRGCRTCQTQEWQDDHG